MSAFLVSHDHIAALIRFKYERERRYSREYTDAQMKQDAEMLAAECVKSVSYRYPSDPAKELPGPIKGSIAVNPRFTLAQILQAPRLEPVSALKQIDCYEYQSCEHPGWETSQARQWCEQLRGTAIGCLPGYEDAPWGL